MKIQFGKNLEVHHPMPIEMTFTAINDYQSNQKMTTSYFDKDF